MIRKDVNDALNNLKKDSPKPPEEKHIKSKYDDMSPDELLNVIKSEKDSRPAPAVKKLKRLQPAVPKTSPEPEKTAPKKKRIIIGELPDYDNLEKQEKVIPEKKPVKVSGEKEVSEYDGLFTVEEIKESTESTLKSISEAMAIINDEVPKKEPEKIVAPKAEKVADQAKAPEKKQENTSQNKKKKKKNSTNKPVEKKSETKQESKPVEKKSETKQESKPVEKKSETQQESKPLEKKPETKPEVKSEEKKSDKSGQNKNKKTNSGTEKKTENKEVKKATEKKTETSGKSEKKAPENKKKSESVPDKKTKNNLTEQTEKVSTGVSENKGKYNLLGLVCIILAIVGVIAIINTCISNMGGGKSSKDKFAQAVYPAVIMDINEFDNPLELPNDQIISASIWSAIIDEEKISQYKERMGVVIIPAVDVENFAVELFGEDIPTITHSTVSTVESKFYYNEEAQSYSVQVKPDTFTYSPEVVSVLKENGNYIVNVEYVDEHPEWMEKSVSKTAEYSLSKNDNGGYRINSMRILNDA
ncbi:MAG: hypothetical protein K2L10_11705 [Ruminococcus sp.]|nr:hypothetical protein [Ruminococcus sp.]